MTLFAVSKKKQVATQSHLSKNKSQLKHRKKNVYYTSQNLFKIINNRKYCIWFYYKLWHMQRCQTLNVFVIIRAMIFNNCLKHFCNFVFNIRWSGFSVQIGTCFNFIGNEDQGLAKIRTVGSSVYVSLKIMWGNVFKDFLELYFQRKKSTQ